MNESNMTQEFSINGIDVKSGPLAFGLWRFAGTDVKTAQAKIETALHAGMTLMDNADVYGYNGSGGWGDSESLQGEVLKATPSLRDQMIVATKGGVYLPGPYRSEKKYLIEACDQSLKRLGVDVIDLYQIHRPDSLTPFAEVVEALEILHGQGKIKAAGVSNYSASQMRTLDKFSSVPIVTMQPEISVINQEAFFDGITDYAQETDKLVLAWSPIGGGALASAEAACERGGTASDVYQKLAVIAEREGVEPWHVALKFLMMHQSAIVPILGTQNIERIKSSSHSSAVQISRVEWYELMSASIGKSIP